jgi:hypothetical protein
MFQTVNDKKTDRSKHVWIVRKDKDGTVYKCVLCGAVTHRPPPDTKDEGDWMPDTFEKLTDGERNFSPMRK